MPTAAEATYERPSAATPLQQHHNRDPSLQQQHILQQQPLHQQRAQAPAPADTSSRSTSNRNTSTSTSTSGGSSPVSWMVVDVASAPSDLQAQLSLEEALRDGFSWDEGGAGESTGGRAPAEGVVVRTGASDLRLRAAEALLAAAGLKGAASEEKGGTRDRVIVAPPALGDWRRQQGSEH